MIRLVPPVFPPGVTHPIPRRSRNAHELLAVFGCAINTNNAPEKLAFLPDCEI